MLRYRCPHCSQLLQAHELRAGKKSVCNGCLTSHIIPADRTIWLNEAGEPLAPRREPVSVLPTPEPPAPAPVVVAGPVEVPIVEPVVVAPAVPVEVPSPAVELDHRHHHGAAVAVTVAPPPAVRGFPGHGGARTPEPQEPPITPPTPSHAAHEPDTRVSPEAQTPAPSASVRLMPLARPAPTADQGSGVSVASSIQARTQADITAALTEALTRRMKPPRKPHQDLRVSTALWLLLTGGSVALILLALFTAVNPAKYARWVLVLGSVQVLFGYVWIVRLTGQRVLARGLACAVPPATFYYLGQSKYAKWRPLRFVATGAVLVGAGLLLPLVSSTTREFVGVKDSPAPAKEANPGGSTKLDQLRSLRERKAYDQLIELLRSLAQTDQVLSADAKYRDGLAAEMKSLTNHPDTGVKVAALEAYARWGGVDAREVCIAALGRSEEEKLAALKLLPQWKGTDAAGTMAQAVAALIVRPGLVTNRASAALEEIGGPAAEQAALSLLTRADEQTTRLIALNVLEKVGGEEAVNALRGYAGTTLDQSIKEKTLDTVEVIRTRTKK